MAESLVSIYIPTKNRRDLLERCLASVFSQTYANIEVVVVDDGSTDGTREYLLAVQAREPKLRVIGMNTSVGGAAARNVALRSCAGEFVTGVDDDDFIFPTRVASFVETWRRVAGRNAELVALFDQSIVLRPNGAHISNISQIVKYSDLFGGNAIGNQIFCQTQRLADIGFFDEDLEAFQDWDCWLRLLKSGGIAQNVRCTTYLFDQRHAHERISKKPEMSLRAALEKVVAKHSNATYLQQSAMRRAVLRYPQVRLRPSEFFHCADPRFLSYILTKAARAIRAG